MRFDDSLKTVLAADTSTAFGATAAFRQLVDLVARQRAPADASLLERIGALRATVPEPTRAAVARGLALADPPAPLIGLFARDTPEVAAAVLRAARLSPDDWDALIPALGPHGRSVLRRRDDLPSSAVRALEAFGATDFSLSHQPLDAKADSVAAPPAPATLPEGTTGLAAPAPLLSPAVSEEAPATEPRRSAGFEISDLVSRIETFQRTRPAERTTASRADAVSFRFETDTDGIIRWTDGSPRGAIVGLTLDHDGKRPDATPPAVDGVAAGAFRRRAPFDDARLQVRGASALTGDWRISASPVFDHASGRFLGFRGRARRPRLEEDAVRLRTPRDPVAAEGLRRLVHELRTPTNAIAGFSELIEREMLGPVPAVYRERASDIRQQVAGLVGAFDDLETAARIEGDALDLRPGPVAIAPVLARVAGDLAPLSELRGSQLVLPPADEAAWTTDSHGVERLLRRLLATVVGATRKGEVLAVRLEGEGSGISLSIDRPAAFAAHPGVALLAVDDEAAVDTTEGVPLLGLGFALRLARNVASELGGCLVFGDDRLTLTLPTALNMPMETASTIAP